MHKIESREISNRKYLSKTIQKAPDIKSITHTTIVGMLQ